MLRSMWRAPAASPSPPRRVWRDYALLALIPVFAVLEALLRQDVNRMPFLAAVAVVILLVPTLLWRRTMPLTMLVVAVAALGIVSLFAGNDDQPIASAFVMILLYAVARWGSGRSVILGFSVVLAHLWLTVLLGRTVLADVVGSIVVILLIALLGLAFRFRASARLDALERARLLERESLARDLHDTVAHHVSAIAVRAQAGLATSQTHPAAAADALRVIEAEASRALDEMRTIVRVLRLDATAGATPAPGVAQLARLGDDDQGGPHVDVRLKGDIGGLVPGLATTVYRLAQESVTNARRHARNATRIEVVVQADETTVSLTVTDDGEHAGAGIATTGYGIPGMIERAALLGGSCTAGRTPHRGWVVTAVLPRQGASA
ncbi:histidine kinase [Okibacterium endophyticum]